jgi:hypothetical protein
MNFKNLARKMFVGQSKIQFAVQKKLGIIGAAAKLCSVSNETLEAYIQRYYQEVLENGIRATSGGEWLKDAPEGRQFMVEMAEGWGRRLSVAAANCYYLANQMSDDASEEADVPSDDEDDDEGSSGPVLH